jgi:hypothetical protein
MYRYEEKAIGRDFLQWLGPQHKGTLSEGRLFCLWLSFLGVIRFAVAWDHFQNASLRKLNTVIHVLETIWILFEYYLWSRRVRRSLFSVIVDSKIAPVILVICFNAVLFVCADAYLK